VLRTSLICGFPGETEEDFEELCCFLREYRIERAGIFAYSPEEGSAAALMEGQLEEEEKRRRQELLTQIQLEVVDAYCEAQIGKSVTVLCEGYDEEFGRFYGRSGAESPEIDGRIYFADEEELNPGQFYTLRLTAVEDGELIGEREEKAL
jgi:ribosomal protein S12 methylthiotransferase